MEDSVNIVSPRKARKRIRQPDKWKNIVGKKIRYSPAALPEFPKCKHDSKAFQCSRLTMRDLLAFHSEFYKIKAKLNQDNFLVNCITTQPIKRRRTKDSSREPRAVQLKFHVRKLPDGTYIPVCKQTFLKILHVTRARVDYVAKHFIAKGTMPTEKRGGDRKSQMFHPKRESVKSFVCSLNCIESHYCRGKSLRKYLSSDLSINRLCTIYNNKVSDEYKVKKSYFRHIFNTSFNLGFKSPKTDACSTCLVMDEKMKSEKDPEKKTVIMINKRVHNLRAKSFYNMLKDKDPVTNYSINHHLYICTNYYVI